MKANAGAPAPPIAAPLPKPVALNVQRATGGVAIVIGMSDGSEMRIPLQLEEAVGMALALLGTRAGAIEDARKHERGELWTPRKVN